MPKKKVNKAPKTNFIALFFAGVFVICGIVALAFVFDFFAKDSYPSVSYTIGEKEYKLSGEKAYSPDGRLLVCFDDIAELCDMIPTGMVNKKIYYAANSNESIELSEGDRNAYVNGSLKDMRFAAQVRGEGIYIPLDFVEAHMSGLDIEYTEDSLVIKRGEYNSSTKDNPSYEDIVFTGGTEVTIEPLAPDKTPPEYDFVADLSAYEPFMCPEDVDGFLILVNRENIIDESYKPENLVPITNVRKDGRSETMVETAEKALAALYIEMRAAGYTDVSVTSGYRSYEKQEYLYNLYTEREMGAGISREEAQKIVDTYSARPGTSEHQTGLCCDMHNLGSADIAFAKKDAYKWLVENCYKFGFILRFPEGKEDITGYSFEPWHYRFVGRYHASEMHRLDMCLEEYTEYLNEQ